MSDAATIVQGGQEGRGAAIWDLVIDELQEQSPKNPRPEAEHNRRVRVAEDGRDRGRFGYEKYGRRLRANDGRDSMVDAYQELLDAVVYMRKAVEEGRACGGLYQRTLELLIAVKAQMEADSG